MSQSHDDRISDPKGMERYEWKRDNIVKDDMESQTSIIVILFLPFSQITYTYSIDWPLCLRAKAPHEFLNHSLTDAKYIDESRRKICYRWLAYL